jgi:hypothetical protein
VDTHSGATVFSRTYRTDNKKGGVAAGIFGDVNALASFANETLDETIDKALNDPDFIAALKSAAQAPKESESIASRLEKLEHLKKKGLITQKEYKQKRELIINSL